MKYFIIGLAVGLGLLVLIFKLIEKNQSQILTLLENLPRPVKINGRGDLKKIFKSETEEAA